METIYTIDIFETKGIEYILVLIYLLALVFFWNMLNKPEPRIIRDNVIRTLRRTFQNWFHFPEQYYYHQGHTWVMPEEDSIVRVGIDDFAQKLLGAPDSILLPPVGKHIELGEKGFQLQVESEKFDLLAPVNGEVIAVNAVAQQRPDVVNNDPYGEGWLLRVKIDQPGAVAKNLIPGTLASAWGEEIVKNLNEKISMSTQLGIVLQDGGMPVTGFAKNLSDENWVAITKELLLID